MANQSNQPTEQFRDKVAIITGGASGIGRALGEHLVNYGAKVVVADLNTASVSEKMQAVQVDVSDAAGVQKLVEQVVAEHGRLDYMFNNAGFAIAGELRDMNAEHWRRIIDVNLCGVIHGVLAAYPVMIKQGHGHIVNTASLAGLIASPPLGAYSTTKHAVVGLSKTLRLEAEGYGVKVSVLCPGFIQSSIYDAGIFVGEGEYDQRASVPFKLMEVEDATRQMLEHILKNKAVITMPAYASIFWRLERYAPVLASLLGRKTIGDFRKERAKAK